MAEECAKDPKIEKFFAAACAGDVAAMQEMIAQGQDVNHAREGGGTALHLAARGGHARAVILLIESGADAAHVNEDGEDAKCAAAAMGRPGIVALITATVQARERRQTAERAEEERLNNLEGIVSAVQGGTKEPVQIRKPLKLSRGPAHG